MNTDVESDDVVEELTFRDRIATVDERGRRNWIFPKKPSGRYYRWRTYVSWLLLGFLFAAPFIRINGEQLVLLNVIERKFVIFGVTFWPQDFHLFVLLMIALIVAIFLFTAVYGRIFCGWICPQTIFMEMVFRKIEYLIEGDSSQQRALRAQPWNAGKIFKKALKLGIFFGLSFLIANLFLAYIIGVDELARIVSHPPAARPGEFLAVLLFSGAFFFVFAWFREQACTLVCPYGRLQSVLLDENSIVISYDFARGEPRKKYRREEAREQTGDCVECYQCVVVCPTGIDIRDGTQLECVNCTACIDACDHVMDKVGFPRGLIRYASHSAITTEKTDTMTPRVYGYTAVLVLLLGLIVYLFLSRTDIETTILRAPGTLYQLQNEKDVRNVFTMKVLNKTHKDVNLTLKLLTHDGTVTMVGGDNINAQAGGISEAVFFVDLPLGALDGLRTNISIGLFSNDALLETVRTTFIGPVH